MPIRHDPRCLEKQAARQAWVEAHPQFCPTCDAHGELTSVENGAPHGAGFWAMESSEPCEQCLGHGNCPRCGETLFPQDNADGDQDNAWYENQALCPHCGWNWGKGKDDFAPSAECDCWIQEEREFDEYLVGTLRALRNKNSCFTPGSIRSKVWASS